MRLIPALVLVSVLALSACGTVPKKEDDQRKLDLKAASFSQLPKWNHDDVSQALAAFQKSCARISKQKDSKKQFGPDPRFGTYGDWKAVCAAPVTQGRAQAWFEQNFAVWKATADGEAEGLFTGYYEPFLNGSVTRTGPYQTPLLKRPDDLVMVDLGEFRESLKGQRIAGRVVNGNLKPYQTRADIVAGKLPNTDDLSIVYVDDPVDAFFLQIQGSGRIHMTDGRDMRLGYAAQNGHAYYAIGRELVKRGEMDKGDVSLQTIRAWLEKHPDQAADFMNLNPSYVFFTPLDGEGPLGGENIPLTSERSLAVDHGKIAYGVPVYLSIPNTGIGDLPSFNRLMVAQDTGGAIKGAVRGDIFWGAGDRAEHLAGHLKAKGTWWFLLPKSITH